MRPSTSSKLMMSCQQSVSMYAFDCWKVCKCASIRRILEINLLALTLFGSCGFRATSRCCKRSWTRRGDSTSRAMTGRGSRIRGRSSSWSRLAVPHKRMHVHPFISCEMKMMTACLELHKRILVSSYDLFGARRWKSRRALMGT